MLLRRVLVGTVACGALAISLGSGSAQAATAKNVLLFITDGCSWGCYDMASHWEHGDRRREAYADFPVRLGMTTFPLNTSTTPTNTGVPTISYDPLAAWNTTPIGSPHFFSGYAYIKQNYTDSAAAGTALATGIKTYNNAINVDDFGNPVLFITQTAKAQGRATGVVSSVPFTHATPAAFGAQNISRNNYHQIAEQMLTSAYVDLIMGGGDPRYDESGQLRATPVETYMSMGQLNRLLADDPAYDRAFISDRTAFQAMADGSAIPDRRVIGIAKTGDTLQANRNASVLGSVPPSVASGNASGVAFNPNVPTLVEMTQGAIRYLSQDPDGFFLMVEGGAVDWMAHGNNTARIIEEQVDFNRSVAWAIDWVETHSNWSETLLIVLTDHGNGMPMGPNSDTIAFQPIQGNGEGVLPSVRWHYGTHTNENTLFFAKGAGAHLFYDHVVGVDGGLVSFLGHGDGRYIDNTGVYFVMRDVLVPEPASLAILLAGLAGLGLVARRSRQTAAA